MVPSRRASIVLHFSLGSLVQCGNTLLTPTSDTHVRITVPCSTTVVLLTAPLVTGDASGYAAHASGEQGWGPRGAEERQHLWEGAALIHLGRLVISQSRVGEATFGAKEFGRQDRERRRHYLLKKSDCLRIVWTSHKKVLTHMPPSMCVDWIGVQVIKFQRKLNNIEKVFQWQTRQYFNFQHK